MRIYLAGPMRGYPAFNWPAFDRAAGALRRAGYEVVNPAELDRVDGLHPTTVVSHDLAHSLLKRDLAILAMCTAIALLPGWERSEGATREFEESRRLGLPAYRLSVARLQPLDLAAWSA